MTRLPLLTKARPGDLTHARHETTLASNRPHMGYIRPACTCGWAGDERDPTEPGQHAAARDDAARHYRAVEEARRHG